MSPQHPDSEAPPPGVRIHEPGGISSTVAQYCEFGDTERAPPPLDELDPKLETIPAPGREERDTMPPGPADTPPDGFASWEAGLDTRIGDLHRALREEQDAFELRIVERMAASTGFSPDAILGAIRALQTDAERHAETLAHQGRLLEQIHRAVLRIGEERAEILTRLEQSMARIELVDRRCRYQHSMPPDGNGAATLPPVT